MYKETPASEQEQHEGFHTSLINETIYNMVAESLDKTSPTDSVMTSVMSLSSLGSYWRERDTTISNGVPSDLILEGTVPIMDMQFVAPGAQPHGDAILQLLPDKNASDLLITGRIVLFEDCMCNVPIVKERMLANAQQKLEDLRIFVLGLVEMGTSSKDTKEDPFKIGFLLYLSDKTPDHLVLDSSFVIPNVPYRDAKRQEFLLSMVGNEIFVVASIFLQAWYGAQLALLHPITKTIFSKGTFSRANKKDRLKKGPTRKKVAKYIRVHRIEDINMEEFVKEEANKILKSKTSTQGSADKRVYTRKKLLWRVIGHYKTVNGKRVWVRPYWAGPLKDFVRKDDIVTQDREILVNDDLKKG